MLWRHGRTEWNATGRFQGQLDPPLDSVGAAQAVSAAEVIAALEPSLLVASDLLRATTTAEALTRRCHLVARHDERLRELHLGGWQGLDRGEVEARFPDEYAAWVAGEDVRRGGGETYAELGARGSAAVLDAVTGVEDGELVVAVTHGGTARATIGVLLDLPADTWWRLGPLGNARWSVLVETPPGWRLVEHNAGVPDVAVTEEERAGDDGR